MVEAKVVLLVVHYVVSLFGMQLGMPIYQAYPYPTMEICEVYKKEMTGEWQLDLEYRLVTRTDCVTKERYEKMIEKKQEKSADE